MSAEIVVCTINVSRIYNVDTDVSRNGGTYCIRGAVTIRKLNDTNYLFQFESECRSHAMVAVLENVVLSKDRKIFQVIVEENLVSFTTDSTAKYELFEEAVLECRMLSELVLRLDAVCRDVYYAGIYASSAANESDLMLSKELQILRDSQVVTSGFNIFALSANKHKNIDVLNIKEGDGEGNSLSISSKTSMDISSNIVCIFCSAQKSNEITEKFAVHPYVPLTFKKEEIYMCLRCMHNWKDYREKAVLDCQLVLEGELNEELCGICSDTPHELIMCCKCPRSFCMTCLSRILTEQQKDDLDKPSDWICMCCTNHVSQASPSLNCSKWQIIGPNHKKNGRNYSSNKYDLKEKNNIKNNFLTDEFISLLTIPKDLCKKIKNQKKEKNKKKKRYENSVNSDKNKMCNLQNSMEFIEERNSLLNKRIVSNSARIESSSSISILSKSSFHSVSESKLKNTRIKDVTFIMNEKEKKCIIQDSPMNSINKIQNKLLDDISKGITPLRNCRLQKLNQNFDKIIPEIKLKNISIIASKTQLKTNKAQSLIMKEFSSVNIPKVNLELSLPPVSSTVDEVYYFSQYIHGSSFDESSEEITGINKDVVTDDVCFLCKDGGELIECDHVYRGSNKRKRCQRVYHTYCLSFAVDDNSKHWTCPKHFCDSCGSKKLEVVCKYCPMSLCEPCVQKNEKTNNGPYRVLPSSERETSCFNSNVKTVVCPNCERMMERCRLRGNDNFCTEITTRPIVPTNTPIQVIKSSKKSSFMCSPLSLLSSYASHGETDSDETLTTKEVSPKLSPKGLLLKSSPKSLALELSPKGLPSRSLMMSVVSSKDSKSDYESEDNTTVTQQCLLPSNKSTNCKKRTANAPASASALNSSTSLVKRNRRENSNPK